MGKKDKGRYQMLWDCPACGANKLLALDHKFCAGCGSPQDPELRYFPSDEDKVAVKDHPFHGADKLCGACDTPNGALVAFCVACGCPLDDAKEAARRRDQVVAEGTAFEGETNKDAVDARRSRKAEKEEARRREMAGLPPESPPEEDGGGGGAAKAAGMGLAGMGCVGIIVLVLVAIVAFFFLNKMLAVEDDVEVAGHQWERSIVIETFQPVKRTAWEDEVPSKGRNVTCKEAVRDTKKVKDGKKCDIRKVDNGDGSFSEVKECTPTYREENIMDDQCTYEVDTWEKTDTRKASGKGLSPAPKWPDLKLTRTGKCRGCQRAGDKSEQYQVQLKRLKDGEVHTCDLSENRWKSLESGQRFVATFGGLSGGMDCSSLP